MSASPDPCGGRWVTGVPTATGNEIFMVQRRARFQHASFSADAIRQILRWLCLLVSVRNFVAVIHRGHNVAARDHAVLHLREAFRKTLYFFHSLAPFAPAHRDRGA